MTLRIFGVRHHGVGCSRALVSALVEYEPDLILLEGPIDAQDALKYAGDPNLRPPVGLLVYAENDPKKSAIYPFTEFSPEWIAIQYADAKEGVEARFIDLPYSIQIALNDAAEKEVLAALEENANESATEGEESENSPKFEAPNDEAGRRTLEELLENPCALARMVRENPLGTLARLAGEEDLERWEERVFQDCSTPGDVFPAFLDVMTELRATIREAANNENAETSDELDDGEAGEKGDGARAETEYARLRRLAKSIARASGGGRAPEEPIREAYMRQSIRQAVKDGAKRIAVVCGAWHSPVLDLETDDPRRKALLPKEKEDKALLKKLPSVKTLSTWIPWTNSRLSRRSGYGAGIESPAFLEELWRASKEAEIMRRITGSSLVVGREPNADGEEGGGLQIAATRSICRAAQLLREDGRETAAANAIDAVRFAEALAATRERSIPGFEEIRDAVHCALCDSDDFAYSQIRERLEVGLEIGVAPTNAPKAPLAVDIEKTTKKLRLKRELTEKRVDVDLREPAGVAKSVFFRQLELINVPWAQLVANRRTLGTFHETWVLKWDPEFEVAIVDGSRFGSILIDAASNMTLDRLAESKSLPKVVRLVEQVLPAKLNADAVDKIYAKLRDVATLSNDVSDALKAVPPLARTICLGSAREDFRDEIVGVFNVLFERVATRLKEVCVGLDEEAAEKCVDDIAEFANSIELLNDDEKNERVHNVFANLTDDANVSSLVSGWLARTLYDRGFWSEDELATKIGLNIGAATAPESVSAWLQGFLRGTGQTILYLDALWKIVDAWLMSLNEDVFRAQSAMLRRAFGDFTKPERSRLMREIRKLRRGDDQKSENQTSLEWDDPALDETKNTLKLLLGNG